MKVRIIAIAGGSCSGKTRLAENTQHALGDGICTIIRQDNFYKDLGGVNPGDPLPNFDHADAFEWELLRDKLLELKSGKPIEIPTYDFTTHRRKTETERVEPTPIVLIEGILILSQDILMPVFDHRFFVECPEDIRLERRLARDVVERGRTPESVHEQFAKQVAPMHDKFVIPSKVNADIVITQNQCGVEMINHNGPLIAFCQGILTANRTA